MSALILSIGTLIFVIILKLGICCLSAFVVSKNSGIVTDFFEAAGQCNTFFLSIMICMTYSHSINAVRYFSNGLLPLTELFTTVIAYIILHKYWSFIGIGPCKTAVEYIRRRYQCPIVTFFFNISTGIGLLTYYSDNTASLVSELALVGKYEYYTIYLASSLLILVFITMGGVRSVWYNAVLDLVYVIILSSLIIILSTKNSEIGDTLKNITYAPHKGYYYHTSLHAFSLMIVEGISLQIGYEMFRHGGTTERFKKAVIIGVFLRIILFVVYLLLALISYSTYLKVKDNHSTELNLIQYVTVVDKPYKILIIYSIVLVIIREFGIMSVSLSHQVQNEVIPIFYTVDWTHPKDAALASLSITLALGMGAISIQVVEAFHTIMIFGNTFTNYIQNIICPHAAALVIIGPIFNSINKSGIAIGNIVSFLISNVFYLNLTKSLKFSKSYNLKYSILMYILDMFPILIMCMASSTVLIFSKVCTAKHMTVPPNLFFGSENLYVSTSLNLQHTNESIVSIPKNMPTSITQPQYQYNFFDLEVESSNDPRIPARNGSSCSSDPSSSRSTQHKHV